MKVLFPTNAILYAQTLQTTTLHWHMAMTALSVCKIWSSYTSVVTN